MESILQKQEAINHAILNGTAMSAFEQYYADDVMMQENEQAPTIGKAANRERQKEFFENIVAFHGATLHSFAVTGNTSMSEWTFTYEHAQWGLRHYRQVAVQQWRDGKVVAERFYYAR